MFDILSEVSLAIEYASDDIEKDKDIPRQLLDIDGVPLCGCHMSTKITKLYQ